MNKFFTVTGLLFHICYYILFFASLGNYEYAGYGVGKAFKFWIFAIGISIIIIAIYLLDGIIAFILSRSRFNTLKLISIIATIPLCVFVGGGANIANTIIWNIYFTAVFVLQIISLFKKQEIKQ